MTTIPLGSADQQLNHPNERSTMKSMNSCILKTASSSKHNLIPTQHQILSKEKIFKSGSCQERKLKAKSNSGKKKKNNMSLEEKPGQKASTVKLKQQSTSKVISHKKEENSFTFNENDENKENVKPGMDFHSSSESTSRKIGVSEIKIKAFAPKTNRRNIL